MSGPRGERPAPLRRARPAPCRNTGAHPADAPPAAYVFTAMPCHVVSCRGALLCMGHPVCVDCGAGLRDGSLVWAEDGADGLDVDLQLITTGGLS